MAYQPRYDENGYRKLDGIDSTPRRQIKGFSASQRPGAYAWARMSSQQRGAMGSQREFQKRLDAQAFRQVADQERQRQQQIHDQGKQDAMGSSPPPAAPKQAPATQQIIDAMKANAAGMVNLYQDSRPTPAKSSRPIQGTKIPFRPKSPVKSMEWTPEQMAEARRRAAERGGGMQYDRNGQVVRNW